MSSLVILSNRTTKNTSLSSHIAQNLQQFRLKSLHQVNKNNERLSTNTSEYIVGAIWMQSTKMELHISAWFFPSQANNTAASFSGRHDWLPDRSIRPSTHLLLNWLVQCLRIVQSVLWWLFFAESSLYLRLLIWMDQTFWWSIRIHYKFFPLLWRWQLREEESEGHTGEELSGRSDLGAVLCAIMLHHVVNSFMKCIFIGRQEWKGTGSIDPSCWERCIVLG